MRDEFGEIDPDEINILDQDADAFGALPLPPDHTDGPPPTTTAARRPQWLIPAIVASVAALVVAAALAWQPWADDIDNGVSFPTGTTGITETLTDQLVFGEPPGELSIAGIGNGADDQGLGLDGAVGFFFAEPGARFQFGEGGGGRWAAFFAVPPDSADAPDMEVVADGATEGTVQGSPASVSVEGAGLISVSFGPVDGRMFSVATSEMSRAETLAFSEAVGVDGDTALIADSTVLGEMLPLGTVEDYFDVLQLAVQSTPFGGVGGDTISVQYDSGGETYALSSIAAGEYSLAMMQFVFGDGAGVTASVTVHDQPAIATTTGDQLFADEPVNLVAWVEGGRLVLVTGPAELDELLALAETVRPATDLEWADVVAVAAQPGDFGDDPFGEEAVDDGQVALAQGPLPDGGTFEFSVAYTDDVLSTCVDRQTDDGGSGVCNDSEQDLPLLVIERSDELEFLLAMAPANAEDVEVRVTLADDSVDSYTVEVRSPDLPGPAAAWLLPDGWQRAELLIDGELITVTEP